MTFRVVIASSDVLTARNACIDRLQPTEARQTPICFIVTKPCTFFLILSACLWPYIKYFQRNTVIQRARTWQNVDIDGLMRHQYICKKIWLYLVQDSPGVQEGFKRVTFISTIFGSLYAKKASNKIEEPLVYILISLSWYHRARRSIVKLSMPRGNRFLRTMYTWINDGRQWSLLPKRCHTSGVSVISSSFAASTCTSSDPTNWCFNITIWNQFERKACWLSL